MPTAKTNAPSKLDAFLLAEAINNAPAWLPGDNSDQAVLHGTVIGLAMGQSRTDDNLKPYPIITYRLDSDCGIHKAGSYLRVHAFHTLLRQQLADAKTAVGIEQMLSYRGKKMKNNPTQHELDSGLAEYHLTFVQNVGDETKPVADDFAF